MTGYFLKDVIGKDYKLCQKELWGQRSNSEYIQGIKISKCMYGLFGTLTKIWLTPCIFEHDIVSEMLHIAEKI